MAITEDQRHRLYLALEGNIGEEANTLMAMLPPVGWADVATKSDLEHLRVVTMMEFDKVRLEMKAGLSEVRADFQRDLREVQRNLLIAMITAMAAQTGILLTVLGRLT